MNILIDASVRSMALFKLRVNERSRIAASVRSIEFVRLLVKDTSRVIVSVISIEFVGNATRMRILCDDSVSSMELVS